jgi:hypothetical protein
MSTFATRRCFIHANREAASLCVTCRRSFCRECVVDHEGRLMCNACLAKATKRPATRESRLAILTGPINILCAVVLCWFVFYMVGRGFLLLEPVRHQFEEAGP